MGIRKFLKQEGVSNLFVLADARLHEDDSEKLDVEPYSYWRSVFRLFIKKPSAIIAIVILVVLALMAIIVPFCYPADYSATHVTGGAAGSLKYAAPSAAHILGCDQLGRDMFVTVFKAVRISFSLALIVAVIDAVIGIVIGTIWGYFKKLDGFFIEIYNVIGNIPSLLLYMLLSFILKQAGANQYFSLIFVMTVTGWLGTARFIRDQIIIINDREYNLASKTLGTSPVKIITHNLLPFILPVIVTNISLDIPAVIGMETALSYFGLGLSNNAIALGPIMTLGYKQWVDYPWTLFVPTVVLGLITMSFYLLGQTLSDCLDPRTHR